MTGTNGTPPTTVSAAAAYYLERGQQYLDNSMWMAAQNDFEAALKLFPNSNEAKKLLQKAKNKMK